MLSERLRIEPLFGLPFASSTLEDVRDHLMRELLAGTRRVVVTANTDHVVRLHRHPDLVATYLAADLVLADGMPLIWGSRLVGASLPERVTGVDLMNALCEGLASEGKGVFLLGSTEDVLAHAARALTERYPGIHVTGTHHGFFAPDQDLAVLSAVNRSGADAVFIGMGSPRQERWATDHAEELDAPLILCVGGSLEVLAGRRLRAPLWVQRAGLEWSYRLLQEPRRLWKRYLVEDAAFVPILAREWRSRHRGRRRARSMSS